MTSELSRVKPGALSHVKLHAVRSIDDLMEMKRWVGERRETPLGVDSESGGLSPWNHRLRLIQLGDLNHGWAVPWDQWGGGALELLNNYEGEFVYHNSSFDLKFMQLKCEYTPPWHRVHDTMTLAALNDPLRPKGLKPLATRLIDPSAAAGETMLKDGMSANKWTWDTVPFDFAPYFVYSALDPVLTCHLWKLLHPRVVQTCPEVYDLERAATRICTNMTINGMLLDVPYVEKSLQELQTFSAEARTWLQEAHGITSPMSGMQVGRALTSLGVEIIAYTESGIPKIDKEVLTIYKEWAKHPQAQQLAEYVLGVRHADKMINSYLSNFLEMRGSDDLIHANINTLAARTGRMSVTDPALQTLPRDDKIIRGSFIPHEGNAFISCDLNQVEARLAASMCKDPGLIEAFRRADEDGEDFFCTIASGIFGEQIQKSDRRRQLTKNVVYTTLYAGGLDTMAHAAGVSTEVMRPVSNGFDATYPGIKQLNETLVRDSRRTNPPSIRGPLNRLFVADRGREFTQITNAAIQGGAAMYLKQCLLHMDAAGLGGYLRLPVHDEVVAEVPAADADEALRLIKECMTNTTDYAVPITADGVVMRERWQK